jgi:hypoxia up-regulated 1
MARLRKEAQKIKKILSANEATPVNIEALTNDIDFRSSITRDEFEKLCGEEIGRATAPVEQLLRQTGKKPSEVHAVVIIGGGSRVPSIKANLMKTMEREVLNQNLNGDEAAALGAGFYAAGLSPSFRVRKVSVEDIFPFGMTATVSRGASSTSKKKAPEAQVFPADTKMPLKKVLTFNRKEDFYMDIKVSNPDRLPKCDSEFIGVYNISGVEAAVKFNETEKPKISVTFELDRSGLLTVTKAEAKVDSYTEEQVEIKVNKTDTNATDANATDANATETDSADADAEEEKKDDTEASDESDESDDAEEGDAEDAAEKKDEKQYETKLVKKVHRVSLDSNFTAVDIVPMLPEQSLAAKSVMKGIKKRMDEIAELNKVKNDVEAHVFETRDALEYDEPLKKVSTEEEKDTIRSSLSEVEEWLWEDHELKEYKDKLKELRKQIKPLKTRKAELEARPEALKYAHEQIESIKAYLKNETAMADVHPNETAIIEKSTADFEAWLAEKVKAQEGKAVTDTPAFLASEVAEEANIHRTTVTDALRPRAKPKAKKPKKKKETKAEKKLRKLREKAAAAAAKLNTTKVNLAAEEEKVIACAEDKKNEDGEVEKRTEDETKACEAAAEAVKTLTASMGKKEKVVEALAAAVAAAEETETLRATVSEAKANVTAADKVVANLTAMKQDCEDKKAAGTEDESDGTCASVPAELEAAQAALEEAMKVSKDLDAQWDAVMKAEAEAKEAKKKAKEAKEAKEAKKKAKDSGGDGEKDADAEDDGTDAAGKEDASKDKEDKEDL